MYVYSCFSFSGLYVYSFIMFLVGVYFDMENHNSSTKVTFTDLLNMPVEIVENTIDYRCFQYWKFFSHDINERVNEPKLRDECRTKTHFIKHHCFDGRRTWELGYVTFDNQPAFFFQAYGREGLDGYGKAIVVQQTYEDLITYLNSLCTYEDYEVDINYSLYDDATWITNFYGQSLFGEFN